MSTSCKTSYVFALVFIGLGIAHVLEGEFTLGLLWIVLSRLEMIYALQKESMGE